MVTGLDCTVLVLEKHIYSVKSVVEDIRYFFRKLTYLLWHYGGEEQTKKNFLVKLFEYT